jgi:hypothetical protein
MIQLLLQGLKVSSVIVSHENNRSGRLRLPSRSTDGPSLLAALLRSDLRHHQRMLRTLYRGLGAVLGISQDRLHNHGPERLECVLAECGGGLFDWCCRGTSLDIG